MLKSTLKNFLKSSAHRVFEFGQRFNLLILPDHYYVSVSSTRSLRANKPAWNHPVDTRFLPLSVDRQRQVLTEWISPYEAEYRGNKSYAEAVRKRAGPGFGAIEAQALHGFIRKTKPKRVIEIGSGVSTLCMLDALQANQKDGAAPCTVTCIEPNPYAVLKSSGVRLLESPVESVDLEVFDQLESGDLLFIDSSHALKPAGDVARIYLEILPRLKSGVLIHIHDIYIPYAFPRDVDRTFIQPMETALLIAMLDHSTRYEILLCMSYLHYLDPALLKRTFPEYSPEPNDGGLSLTDSANSGHFPSSTYLVVK